ncbi:MAG: DUF3592 domain-containing protein [Anaerolineaceae bacterium]|jgi:hypothetical protein
MQYSLAFFLFVLALVFFLPGVRRILFMRRLKKKGIITLGTVLASKSATGWLWTASFGNQDRPLVGYQSSNGQKMIIQLATSSVLPQRRYEAGQTVQVMYDENCPERAFIVPEWKVALRETWVGVAAALLATYFLLAK